MSTSKTRATQTIVTTKFYGPTSTRGARVKVTTRNGSKFVPYDYSTSWNGIDEAGVAAVAAELLQDEHAMRHGDTYTVNEARLVGGPKGDVRYWIVTYTVTYG